MGYGRDDCHSQLSPCSSVLLHACSIGVVDGFGPSGSSFGAPLCTIVHDAEISLVDEARSELISSLPPY